MENLYNAVLSFKGDNSFTFMLPGYGELTVYKGKNVFVKGLTVAGVELLRELKPLLLEHKLNGKPDGCYKVIDLTEANKLLSKINVKELEKVTQPKTVAELKAELIKSDGPIIEDDLPNNPEELLENESFEEGEDKSEEKVEEPKEEKVEEPESNKKDKPGIVELINKSNNKRGRGSNKGKKNSNKSK